MKLAAPARWRVAAAAGIGLAAALVLAWMLRGESSDAQRLDTALFSVSVDDVQARRVTLPHRWATDCAGCVTAWYRFDLPAPTSRSARAIYLPPVGDNVAVYLNGQLLGQGGRFTDPVARLDERPLVVEVPAALWQREANRLLLLVKADPASRGILPAVQLGDAEALAATHRTQWLLRVTMPQIFATAAAMLGLIAALLWTRRRQAIDGALAAACLCWPVYAFAELTLAPPLHAPAWDGAVALLLTAAAAAAWALARRLVGSPSRAAGTAMLAAPIAGAALAVYGIAAGAAPSIAVAFAVALLLLAIAAARLLADAWRASLSAAAVPAALLLGVSLHDLLLRFDAPAAAPALLGYGMAVLLAYGGWVALSRFVDSLTAAELLNIDLEAMVREKTAALHEQFDRVRVLEAERIVAQERERLMRDMHDGVGGSLVSLLSMIEGGRGETRALADAVRGALDDLRLMIDSLEPVDGDLNAVLAMFRDRLAPRLAAAGIALHWDVALLPALANLGPARVLHILRLLQEAVTNALKHGAARSIAIRALAQGEAIEIRVDDDGRGFDPAQATQGRGLKNMAYRARQADGQVAVDSAPGRGARVTLRFSAPPAATVAQSQT